MVGCYLLRQKFGIYMELGKQLYQIFQEVTKLKVFLRQLMKY